MSVEFAAAASDTMEPFAPSSSASGPRGAGGKLQWLVLTLILLVSGTAILTAMRTTSTTFDEIVFMAVGARGFQTGSFDLAPDHPPLMQYLYGLPLAIAGAVLPDESNVAEAVKQNFGYRYAYSSAFFWGSGNDPERMAFLGRLPAVLMALLLVVVTFMFVRTHWGPQTGLLAAALVAFLPDLLAHGGVAYSDVPVTLALFSGVWALDEAVRAPGWRRGLTAGAVAGLAVGIKISAAVLLPIAVGLVGLELARRRAARQPVLPWLRRTGGTAAIAAFAGYLVIVAIYRGDILLEQFRYGLDYRFRHMTGGHGAEAFLLGQRSPTGWWFFFPVAFLFKTSAALHALLAVAAVVLAERVRAQPRRILSSPLRAGMLVLLIFGAILLSSSLNIGFRYAMPVLPWICVLAAVGTMEAWRRSSRGARALLAALVFWAAAFPLSYHPHFLSFISEYGPGRARNYTVLVDSSLDWGQGLLELRRYMNEHGIRSVYLSYFGSASPAGYGIPHVPLASFFPLPPAPPVSEEPTHLVISATNLAGVYFPADPYARFRDVEPDTVLANTLFVFELGRAP